jgi:hypothetical protein
MKIKEWLQRVLWFVSGALVTGILFVAPAFINKTEASVNSELPQDLTQRVVALERRVKAIEDARAEEDKRRQQQEKANNRRNR